MPNSTNWGAPSTNSTNFSNVSINSTSYFPGGAVSYTYDGTDDTYDGALVSGAQATYDGYLTDPGITNSTNWSVV